jgi:hypothetical protein
MMGASNHSKKKMREDAQTHNIIRLTIVVGKPNCSKVV